MSIAHTKISSHVKWLSIDHFKKQFEFCSVLTFWESTHLVCVTKKIISWTSESVVENSSDEISKTSIPTIRLSPQFGYTLNSVIPSIRLWASTCIFYLTLHKQSHFWSSYLHIFTSSHGLWKSKPAEFPTSTIFRWPLFDAHAQTATTSFTSETPQSEEWPLDSPTPRKSKDMQLHTTHNVVIIGERWQFFLW